uniref:Uncharacterized protein n=1 Tax=Panagrolaimus davidi TaxID=227884 RepID=A0A914P181_9BILA
MNFYVSDSVLCDVFIDAGVTTKKNCTSCVSYTCSNVGSGEGCPDDFFQRCSGKHKQNVDVVKSKNFNDLEYRYNGVDYISGCQNEIDGSKCIFKKDQKFYKNYGEDGSNYVCTEAGKPCSESDDGTKSSNNQHDTSSSNNQHDALKMIGIFVIGWVLSAA